MSIGGGVVEKFQKPDFGRVVVSSDIFDNKQAERVEGLAVTAHFLFHCKNDGK